MVIYTIYYCFLGGVELKLKYKNLAASISALLFLLFLCGFTLNFNAHVYSTDRIINTIKELSSKEYNGRLAGTTYGVKTEEYVANEFKEIGLKPANNGSYFQEFEGIYGNTEGEYILEITNGNNIVKKYLYGMDYKAFSNYENNGEATAGFIEINDIENIPNAASGQIAMLRDYNMLYYNDENIYSKLYDKGYRGLIVIIEDPTNRRKGETGIFDDSSGSKLPRVGVSENTYNELKKLCVKGNYIHLKSQFTVKNFTARNVIGIIESNKHTDETIMISAHMDHLGPEPDGIYFPGALDNASGTACIIEIARTLIAQGLKPDINIIIAAFNAEEEGLLGSTYYVRNPIYSLDKTEVVNLDMVGARSSMPLTILYYGYSTRDSNNFVEEIKSNADKLNYKYDIMKSGSSDHAPFGTIGLSAVTFIDYEKNIYHVPEDNLSNIGVENLKRTVDLTLSLIQDKAYSDSGNKNILIIITAITILSVFFVVFRINSNKKTK